MELKNAVQILQDYQKESHAYMHAMGLLSYDGATGAPKHSAQGRAETMGVLSGVYYNLLVNEKIKEALDTVLDHRAECDRLTVRCAELIKDSYDELTCVPADEFAAYQMLLSEADAVWHDAKETSNFAMFSPYLEKIVAYNRRLALHKKPDANPYDTLLGIYEKGLSMDQLDPFFALLRNELSPLILEIGRCEKPCTDFLHRRYPAHEQEIFNRRIMQIMNIDPADCSLGETEHPFTTNFNKHDVRITTHYYEDDLSSAMFSTIHEGGHALYELNIGDDLCGTVTAGGCSMSIHESQSRFYENLIGRSEAFCTMIYPIAREIFPEQLKDVTPDEFWRGFNMAEPSLIRTEADELTYSLHVMIRYELEKRMISGDIPMKDLPGEWNRMYKEYLGVTVPDDRHGVLQDSHWSGGLLGYFPSYALGSAYGVQMLSAMEKNIDVWKNVSEGKIAPITAWLSDKVHRYGMLLTPGEVIRNACGAAFDPHCYVDYLKKKYSALYHIG